MSGAAEFAPRAHSVLPRRALWLSLALHGGVLGVFVALSWQPGVAPQSVSPWQVSLVAPAPITAVDSRSSPVRKPAAAGKAPEIPTPPRPVIHPAGRTLSENQEPAVATLQPAAGVLAAVAGVSTPVPEKEGTAASLSEPEAASHAAQDAVGEMAGAGPSAQQRWYAAFVAKLRESRRYPVAARRLGQEGMVVLVIEIGADGELRNSEVRRSSGFPLLDVAATHLVREAASALRGQLHPPGDSRLEVPVAFRLDDV